MSNTPDYEKMLDDLLRRPDPGAMNADPQRDGAKHVYNDRQLLEEIVRSTRTSAICAVDLMIDEECCEDEIGEHDCHSGCPCKDEKPKYTGPTPMPPYTLDTKTKPND